MLFFTFSYLVCLVIDKHDFFIFYKISIDDSLYQHQLSREDLDPEALRGAAAGVIVAPREADRQAADLSRVLGYAITLALQPGLSLRDVEMLVDG